MDRVVVKNGEVFLDGYKTSFSEKKAKAYVKKEIDDTKRIQKAIAYSIIVLLLLGIFFKEEIKTYFKQRSIIKNASIYQIPKVDYYCKIMQYKDIAYKKNCLEELTKMTNKQNGWNKLIKENSKISCGDFDNYEDADLFYQYVGGGIVKQMYSKSPPNPNNLRCSYDPFGLDTDHDCEPCENEF